MKHIWERFIGSRLAWNYEVLSVGELGVRLHLNNDWLSPLLKRLPDAGFGERRRDADDSIALSPC